ncbi:MAG: DUF3892 domain-containing protein [Proteobacteria bacterium]|nr:DUF3892 domain-containing protein [Pseudomonadota bacterium]
MTLRITGRREDENGANTHYRLSDGRIVTRAEAVKMCENGELPNYHIYERDGIKYLRDNPDTSEMDNIDNQPLI